MAGIYIHVPFCKTKCIYCDFYSSTRRELQSRYVRSLCRELAERKDYLKREAVRTVYFGGGTPSLLPAEDFHRIFDVIEQNYGLTYTEEITLEANPDDLTEDYLQSLRNLPLNRISIGIQTFNNELLRLLRRRHDARQAIEAVDRCRRAGFDNISIDLMYGLPGETDADWEKDLQQAISLGVEHISAYHLTYEEQTPIHRMLQQKQVTAVEEESSLRFFTVLMDSLTDAGYEHYEISNFCKPGRHSRHNSSYWQSIPYLGCGPSAHSFDGESRSWNTSSLTRYVTSVERGMRLHETELPDKTTRYNEFIITGLRTSLGISVDEVELRFGSGFRTYCLEQAEPYLRTEHLSLSGNRLRLTRKGIFVSDGIMSDLLYVE